MSCKPEPGDPRHINPRSNVVEDASLAVDLTSPDTTPAPLPLPALPATRSIDLQPRLEALSAAHHEPLALPGSLRAAATRGRLVTGIVTPRHLLLFEVNAVGAVSALAPVMFEPGTTELHLCGVHLTEDPPSANALLLSREGGRALQATLVSFDAEGVATRRSLSLPDGLSLGFAGEETCRSVEDTRGLHLLGMDEGDGRPLLLSFDASTDQATAHLLGAAPLDAMNPGWSWTQTKSGSLVVGAHLSKDGARVLGAWTLEEAGVTEIALPPSQGLVVTRDGRPGLVILDAHPALDPTLPVPLMWYPLSNKQTLDPSVALGEISPRALDGPAASCTLDGATLLGLTPFLPSALPTRLGAVVEVSKPDEVLLHQEGVRGMTLGLWDHLSPSAVGVFLFADPGLWPEPASARLEVRWLPL